MRKSVFQRERIALFAVLATISTLLSGCATIVGGSHYYAHVIVDNRPGAAIFYKGENMGRGQALIKVPRTQADKLVFQVKEENGTEQEFRFNQKCFRSLAFVGTALLWTGITKTGIPLPWGVVLDFSTGALWKPDIMESGVSEISCRHFKYLLTYTGFQPEKVANSITNIEDLKKLKTLLDKGILTQKEFDEEKAKILTK